MKRYYAHRIGTEWTKIDGKFKNMDAALDAIENEDGNVMLTHDNGGWLDALCGFQSWMRFRWKTEVCALGTSKKEAEATLEKLHKEALRQQGIERHAAKKRTDPIRKICEKKIENQSFSRQLIIDKLKKPQHYIASWVISNYSHSLVAEDIMAKIATLILDKRERSSGEDEVDVARREMNKILELQPPRHNSTNPLEFPLNYAEWRAKRDFAQEINRALEIFVSQIDEAQEIVAMRAKEWKEYQDSKK